MKIDTSLATLRVRGREGKKHRRTWTTRKHTWLLQWWSIQLTVLPENGDWREPPSNSSSLLIQTHLYWMWRSKENLLPSSNSIKCLANNDIDRLFRLRKMRYSYLGEDVSWTSWTTIWYMSEKTQKGKRLTEDEWKGGVWVGGKKTGTLFKTRYFLCMENCWDKVSNGSNKGPYRN